MDITEISEQKEIIEIINNNKAVVLYFYNDHCAPCISLRPKLEALFKTYFPKFKYIYVNGEKFPSIQANFDVYENPVILFSFEGKEFFRENKYVSLMKLKEKIGRIYNILFDI